MKKLFRQTALFAIAAFLLLVPQTAFSAMTCVDGGINTWPASGDYLLAVTCTVDTTPATAVDTLPATTQAVIDLPVTVTSFSVVPSGTGPTDDSDLAITDALGRTIISATGNGQNVVDESTVTSVIYGDGPVPGTDDHNPKGDGNAWTITVTNNAVNNSGFTLYMQAKRTALQ